MTQIHGFHTHHVEREAEHQIERVQVIKRIKEVLLRIEVDLELTSSSEEKDAQGRSAWPRTQDGC